MRKITKYNPEKFRQDLDQLRGEDVKEVALHWKGKAHSIKNEMVAGTQDALEIGLTGLTAFGLSYLNGGWRADDEHTNKLWLASTDSTEARRKAAAGTTPNAFDDGGKERETELMGIPKTLWSTVVLGGAAVFMKKSKYNAFIRAAAIGSMATWASEAGDDMGHKAGEDAHKKDKDSRTR